MLLMVIFLLTLGDTGYGALFDIIGNVTLEYTDGSEPFMTKTMDKACECRNLCFVQPVCMAVSFQRVKGNTSEWLCKIFINETQQNPTDPKKYKLVPSPNTYLAARSVQPKVTLEQDGFYYVVTKEISIIGGRTLPKSKELCSTNFPSFELAAITTNVSLDVARQFTDKETAIALNMWESDGIIRIGTKPVVLVTDTELCDKQAPCDLSIIGRTTASWQVYGLLKGKLITIQYSTSNGNKNFRALCQGNFLGLEK